MAVDQVEQCIAVCVAWGFAKFRVLAGGAPFVVRRTAGGRFEVGVGDEKGPPSEVLGEYRTPREAAEAIVARAEVDLENIA